MINPLGPLKLLNFKDRVPKAVQKWRLDFCGCTKKVRKLQNWVYAPFATALPSR